jgi:hypothetical protein
MKTKLLALLFIPIMLTGCFGGDGSESGGEQVSVEPGKVMYDAGAYSIIYPEDWEVIETADFTSNVPMQTLVGFRSNIKNEIFSANVNVVRGNVEEGLSSKDYGKSSLINAQKSLISFEELGKENINFTVNDAEIETYIAKFQGQQSASDPMITFRQLYLVSNSIGYVVTAAYEANEDESIVNATYEMLKSFRIY